MYTSLKRSYTLVHKYLSFRFKFFSFLSRIKKELIHLETFYHLIYSEDYSVWTITIWSIR